jgi:hypothetical protein
VAPTFPSIKPFNIRTLLAFGKCFSLFALKMLRSKPVTPGSVTSSFSDLSEVSGNYCGGLAQSGLLEKFLEGYKKVVDKGGVVL